MYEKSKKQFKLRYILLGITGKNRTEIQLKNYIILLGKYFIFKSKYQKQQPNLLRFKSYLCQRINIEKHIYFSLSLLYHIIYIREKQMFENSQCASCTFFFFFVFCNSLTFTFVMANFPFFVNSKLFLNILCRRYNCKVPVHRHHIFVLNSYVKTVIYRYTRICNIPFMIHAC